MKDRRGFTIIEVVVAILVLTTGLLALAGTAATVTRMITQGQLYSEASAMATERIEILRGVSCDNMASGSSTQGRFTVTWRVQSVVVGRAREVTVLVNAPTTSGTRVDTFATTIACQ